MDFHTIQLIQWLMWLCQFLCYLVWVSRDITRWYCDQPVVWPEVEHLLGTPSKYAKSKPSTHLNHTWWCHWRFLNDPHVITHNITHVYSILLNTDAFAVCSWMIDWILGLLSELLWQCKLFFVFIVYEWQQLLSPCTQTECCQESRTLSVAVCIVVHTQTLLLSYSSYLLLTKDFQGCLLTNMAWFLNYGNTVSPTKHRRHNI